MECFFDSHFGLVYARVRRLVPSTHEAYGFARLGEKLSYLGGHITKIKRRTSEEFIQMAEAAGVAGGIAGTTIAGLRYETAGLELGGLIAYTHDAFNI